MTEINEKTKVSETELEDFQKYFEKEFADLKWSSSLIEGRFKRYSRIGLSYSSAKKQLVVLIKDIEKTNEEFTGVLLGSKTLILKPTISTDDDGNEKVKKKKPFSSFAYFYNTENNTYEQLQVLGDPKIEHFTDVFGKLSKVFCEKNEWTSKNTGFAGVNHTIKRVEYLDEFDLDALFRKSYLPCNLITEEIVGKSGGYKIMVIYGQISDIRPVGKTWNDEDNKYEDNYSFIEETDGDLKVKLPCFSFLLNIPTEDEVSQFLRLEFPKEYYGRTLIDSLDWDKETITKINKLVDEKAIFEKLNELLSGLPVFCVCILSSIKTSEQGVDYIKGYTTYMKETKIIENDEMITRKQLNNRNKVSLTKFDEKSTDKKVDKKGLANFDDLKTLKDEISNFIGVFGENISIDEFKKISTVADKIPDALIKTAFLKILGKPIENEKVNDLKEPIVEKKSEEKKPEPKVEKKSEEKKPEPKVEKKPEPKVEKKPEPKVEKKPEPKVEKKPEPKVEKKPEPKVESDNEISEIDAEYLDSLGEDQLDELNDVDIDFEVSRRDDIIEYIKTNDNGTGISIDVIKSHFFKDEKDKKLMDDIIKRLLLNGSIYETKKGKGIYKIVE